jgi:hypothetical protein
MACSCFFRNLRKIQEDDLVHSIQNIGLKQILISGKLRRKRKLSEYEEESNWLNKFMRRICTRLKNKKKWIRFLERGKEEVVNKLSVWMPWLSDLIVEVFVMGKPEFPKNFCTDRKRSSLENIGTIFIALQLHWSNGYCISSSSSDDG